MLKIINMKGKDVTCACNALTPFLYTQIFHEDFMRVIIGFRGFAGKDAKNLSDDDIAELTKRSQAFAKLAFIMAKQAELKDAAKLTALTDLDFYTWLSEIEPQAFQAPEVMSSIIGLWQGNSETTATAKN